MVVKTYGSTQAPGWDGNGDPQDAGAIRMFGCYVKDISMSIGWGTSATTCDITLIEEIDRGTGLSLFQEPEEGSAAAICIPNDEYPNDPSKSFRFIGIVTSYDNEESTSGKTKKVRLADFREILKDIPVYMNKMFDKPLKGLKKINNFTYAYNNYSDDPYPTRNKHGLIMKAIKNAVEDKVYKCFTHDGVNFQTYEVDMSMMFAKRNYKLNKTGYKLTQDVFNADDLAFDDKETLYGLPEGTSDDFIDDEIKRVCSYYYRIPGDSKSLIEIIDQAMSSNTCDWYIYAYEKDYPFSLNSGKVTGRIVIRIMPIPRNDFNEFTTTELNNFINTLDNVVDSKSNGKELANEISNKIIFGSPYEKYHKANISNFRQFWGFKKQPYDTEKIKEITDRYGQTIQVRGDINENPTFDTSSIGDLTIDSTLFTDRRLKMWLVCGLGYLYSEVSTKTRSELIEMIQDDVKFDNEYEFLLDTSFNINLFYFLKNCCSSLDSFMSLLLNVYHYVRYYDYVKNKVNTHTFTNVNGDEVSMVGKYSGIGFSDIQFCGQAVNEGEVITITPYSSEIMSLNFSHYIVPSDDSTLVRSNNPSAEKNSSAIQVKYNNVLVSTMKDDTRYGLTSSWSYFLGSDYDNMSLSLDYENRDTEYVMYPGLHRIQLISQGVDDPRDPAENLPFREVFTFYVYYTHEWGVNPYEMMRNTTIYEWAKKTLIKLQYDPKLEEKYRPSKIDLSSVGVKDTDEFYNIYDTKYLSAEFELLNGRVEQLYNIVKSYIDKYVDKMYYAPLSTRDWIFTGEAWDGKGGQSITNSYIRGKFINKETGKMPTLYQINNATNIKYGLKESQNQGDDILYIYGDENNENKSNLNVYGKASCELFGVGKTSTEADENRYAVVTLGNMPSSAMKEYAATDLAFEDADNVIANETAVKDFIHFYQEARKMGIIDESRGVGISLYLNPALRVVPDYFYLPAIHAFIRYGPWVLDFRNGDDEHLNRSNYGITNIEYDTELNPWTFKSYDDVQDFMLYQHENSLMTEHRMNRAQISCSDIPRYNVGDAVGDFANISSINISYAANGVKTTYTLTTIGAGQRAKAKRQNEHIITRLRNIEDNVKNAQEWITKDARNQMFNL